MPAINELNRTGQADWGTFVAPLEQHLSALGRCRLRGPQMVLAHVLVNFATRSLVRWGLAQSDLQSYQILAAVPSLVPLLTRLNRRRGFPDRDQCFQTQVVDNIWLHRLGFTEVVFTHTGLPGESLFILTVAACSGYAKEARAALMPILAGRLEPSSPGALKRLQAAAQRMSRMRTALATLIDNLSVESFQEVRPYNADAVSLLPDGRSFGGGSGADDPYLLSLDRLVFAPLPGWYMEGYLPDRLAALSRSDRRRYEADCRLPSLLELALRYRSEPEFISRVLEFVKRYNAAMGVHWRSVVRYLIQPPGVVDRGTAQVLIETVKRLLDVRRGDPRIKELAPAGHSRAGGRHPS